MTLIDELSSWVGTVAQRNDPESRNLANCMRRAVAELEKIEAEKEAQRQAKVSHAETYGRRSSAPNTGM